MAAKIYKRDAMEIHDGAKSGDKVLKKYRNVGKTALLQLGYSSNWPNFANKLREQGVLLDYD